MIVVVDASVAVKWFVEEQHRDSAIRLLDSSAVRIAPDHLLSEVCGALARKVRDGELERSQADAALDRLPAYFSVLPSAQFAVAELFDLTREVDHPIADLTYLAIALRLDAVVVTADERFLRRLNGTRFGARCAHVSAWRKGLPSGSAVVELDPELVSTLIRLSDHFQETKVAAGNDRTREAAINLAEKRLLKLVADLDASQLAHVVATCWLGQLGHAIDGDRRIRADWDQRLAEAFMLVAEGHQQHRYTVSKLQFLELGLALLGQHSGQAGQN